MRMSALFGRTLREVSAEVEAAGHRFLLRAGYVRQLGAGVFSVLPLGLRALQKIETILRDEMDKIGGQEIAMPLVQPAEIWKETGRWYQIGAEMTRFKDRYDREMVLAMTHEEAVADLVRREIQSHRDLPRLVYQIQTKWRDDPRPRGGLLRVREFTMKDSYSLDADAQGLDRQYQAHVDAYLRIFQRCGLPVTVVGADVGMMGGSESHEFMYLSDVGEDTVVVCDGCGRAANRQVARFHKETPPQQAPDILTEVATPGATTIASLSEYLNVSASQTAKAVFLVAEIARADRIDERFVIAVLRGDMELSLSKLAAALGARELRPAIEEEIRHVGVVPGYGSPIGVEGATVVVDDLIAASPNLVVGANRDGYHLTGSNYGRDYKADIVTDIAAVLAGALCPHCHHPLHFVSGVEVGNTFKLGTRYSETVGCTFHDEGGQLSPVVMGSYGIGVGRLLAAIAEEHHDEDGLVWPLSVAPFHVHLVAVGDTEGAADRLYDELGSAQVETLYDDRPDRAGVKFTDADLIGLPLRVTIGKRSLAQRCVELKERGRDEKLLVPLEEAVDLVSARLREVAQRAVGPNSRR